jgi:hypothetical protein
LPQAPAAAAGTPPWITVQALEAGRRLIRGVASIGGGGDWDPCRFLHAGVVVKQNRTNAMVGKQRGVQRWGMRKQGSAGFFLRAVRSPVRRNGGIQILERLWMSGRP